MSTQYSTTDEKTWTFPFAGHYYILISSDNRFFSAVGARFTKNFKYSRFFDTLDDAKRTRDQCGYINVRIGYVTFGVAIINIPDPYECAARKEEEGKKNDATEPTA